ncbi:MAG: HtrA2 peptidase [Ferruginibacter sp.]|uniref:Do family serine endopeptidase n=1 Tax=Ferruginibacter sp. TaxID=1940288 RepID=UPI002657EEA0|nr:Do family serine endopeptidase [Ferruginibacter sp.]MDB5276530.1 HtrA2 peptidase [Ferruginibacter sp.]
MKKFLLILTAACMLLAGCHGQARKNAVLSGKANVTTFEEKQQQDIKNEGQLSFDPSAAAVFNFRYAAKKATPGVVHIKSSVSVKAQNNMPDFFKDFFGDELWRRYFRQQDDAGVRMGSASGVIVSNDGYIVTNYHVVSDADSIEVILHDQRTYKAGIVGTDPATDLALLKIDEHKLAFIEFGNSDSVEVGDLVLAVGNPFNLASTVTAGIVSAKARNINIISDKSAIESFIQTDAAVNPGNSGGALVDINGKLIGINAAISTPTGVYAGYAFAIPVEIVKKTIDDLLRYGKVMRGYLGIIISDMNGAKAKMLGIASTTGVMVDSIQQNSAAAKAGILPKDVITKVGLHEVETATQLREVIARYKPGEKLQLTLIRNGKEKIIEVTLMPEQLLSVTATPSTELLKKLGVGIANLSAKEKEMLHLAGGVKITTINDGTIGRTTQMQEGFIVTKVNRKPVNNTDEFIRSLQDSKEGVLLEGIYPGIAGIYYYAFGL